MRYDDVKEGLHVLRGGTKWFAIGPDLLDLEQSTVGSGDTPEEAIDQWRLRRGRKTGACGQKMPATRDFTVHYEEDFDEQLDGLQPFLIL